MKLKVVWQFLPRRRQASLDHLAGFMDPTHHQNVLKAARVPPKKTADMRDTRTRPKAR